MSTKKKKGGSFFGALFFFVFFFFILIAAALAVAYTIRDRLITEYVVEKGPRHFGVEALAFDSITTRPLGNLSFEVNGLIFKSSPNAPAITAEKVMISTPKSILGIYQLFLSKETLVVKAQMIGLKVQATSKTDAPPNSSGTSNPGQNITQTLPFPLSLEAELRESYIEFGSAAKPVRIGDLTGILRADIQPVPSTNGMNVKSTGQFVLKVGVGERAELPIRTEWSLQAKPTMTNGAMTVPLELTSLSISSLGVTLKSEGKLEWPSQSIEINAAGYTTDLGVIPLDKAESQALGLEGRMKGAADISVSLAGSLKSALKASGMFKLKNATLPFQLSRQTPRPFVIKGPVDADVELPFGLEYDFGTTRLKSLDLQLATIRVDFTQAEVRVEGFLRKPPALMMGLQSQLTAAGDTVDVANLEFRLANLLVATKGQVSIDPKRNSKLEFRVTLPNLQGWPQLLPVLGAIESGPVTSSTDLNQARGSFALLAHLDAPIADPTRIKDEARLSVETFEAREVSFPIGIKNEAEKTYVQGFVRGSVAGSGDFSSRVWNLKRALGQIDIRDLAVEWKDLVNKAAGKDFTIGFDASSDNQAKSGDIRVRIDKLNLKADNSVMNANGSIGLGGTPEAREYKVDTAVGLQVMLSQTFEMIPKLRALRSKIPSGSVFADYKIQGTFKSKGGIEKSPLTAQGKTTVRAPQVIYLEPKTPAPVTKKKAEPGAAEPNPVVEMMKWPVIANSKLVFDVQFASLTHKTGVAKDISTVATLEKGNLTGTAKIAQIFGGKVDISAIRVPGLSTLSADAIKASVGGKFETLSLSELGEYIDPQFKTLVGGTSTGGFNASIFPFSEASAADTATASGTIAVKNGFLSTLKFDEMVNSKIAENQQIAKLLGIKPQVATKGASFDMQSGYTFGKGRMTLKDLKMNSPEKNALELDGWLQKDFTTELKGTAYINDTQIGGSFRQANSDKQGRLVVPIKISGSLKEPSLEIAEEVISTMVKKTVDLEANKLKNTVKQEATKVIEQKKKEAVDALKEELKKRGLSL